MNEVRISTEKYDALQHCIQTKAARIDALESELVKVKEDHEAEIEKMAKEGKVRCIRTLGPFESLFTGIKSEKEYKGFDDVKAEVEEHFKQGLFNEELEKYKQDQLQHLVKKLEEKDNTIDKLRTDNKRLYNRSLWERIRNK